MKRSETGAALLLAMMTVSLVAALAGAALWQQWRSLEVERAERTRLQSSWVLTGALDWSRLILREDARTGGADHLGEPWATPLAEARLSSFLAQDKAVNDDGPEAFLSGQISDAQAHLNVRNLVDGQQLSLPAMRSFAKLFDLLGLAPEQLQTLAEQLLLALDTRATTPETAQARLLPQRIEQLTWLGLDSASVARLRPYITLLPVATPVNLNTASAEVLYASVAALSMSDATRLVQARARAPFHSLGDAQKAWSALAGQLSDNQHSVASRFFMVDGRLRLEQAVLHERSLVHRNGLEVTTVWRARGAGNGLSTMAAEAAPP